MRLDGRLLRAAIFLAPDEGDFGAGLGIALLAVLGLVIDESLPRLNALKQVLALVINVVAACFFAGSGEGIWSGRSGNSRCTGYWTAQRN